MNRLVISVCADDKIMPSTQMGLAVNAFQNVGANNITSKTYSEYEPIQCF